MYAPRRTRPATALLTLVCALAAHTAHAQPERYTLDPQSSFVHFEVLHFGTSSLRGRLGPASGTVVIDRTQRSGEIGVSLQTATVSTSVAPLDAILRGPQGFDAQREPQAWFVARDLGFDGDRLARVTGELSMRGTSRALTLTATRFSCRHDDERGKEVCGGDFEGEIRRSDFGITHSLPFVADRVKLVVQVEAVHE